MSSRTSMSCRKATPDMDTSLTPSPQSAATSCSESEFRIIYGRGRFPIQQKRADGTLGCCGCGSAIPKGRRSWCSRECYERFEPSRVIAAAKMRDQEVCCVCGHDYKAARAEWTKQCYEAGIHSKSCLAKMKFPYPHKIEYDHITPFSEGGLTVVENIRSLCEKCHKDRTRHWHSQRSAPATDHPELSLDSQNIQSADSQSSV